MPGTDVLVLDLPPYTGAQTRRAYACVVSVHVWSCSACGAERSSQSALRFHRLVVHVGVDRLDQVDIEEYQRCMSQLRPDRPLSYAARAVAANRMSGLGARNGGAELVSGVPIQA